jgi:hypothetical protein
MPPPSVFLADLVRAFALLKPADEDAKRAVAAALGFTWSEALPVETPEPRPAPRVPPTPTAAVTRATVAATPAPEPAPDTRSVVPSTIEQLPEPRTASPLTVEPLAADSGEGPPPPLETLFVPRWTRAILTVALSGSVEEGPVDVDQLVGIIARRHAVSRLPRLPLLTARCGAQLLLDRSPAMTPFLRDQRWLEGRISRIIGTDRVETRQFSACPLRGSGQGPVTEWERPYHPPPPGTPVVALTDLGIGRPPGWDDWASVDEWMTFAAIARRARCRLVAFVPYRPLRWPAQLTRMMTVIHWDRTTTVAMAHKRTNSARRMSE